jgi:type I site-specific restriction endonuclease
LTGDQHTDHISNGQRVSRHSLPTLLYFLFSPPHIFFNSILASRTNGTLAFAPTHKPTLRQKPKEPFFANAHGHDIYFWDLDNYPPKKVYGFPTRDDLERYAYIRKARKQLAGELINTKIAGRNYQIASIRAVMEAVEKRKRKFLLVMATGTGKTRTCIALVDALMRAGWAERVLFLS